MVRITDDDLRDVARILVSGVVRDITQTEAAEILEISFERVRRIVRILVKKKVLVRNCSPIYATSHSPGPEWALLFPHDPENNTRYCECESALAGGYL